MKKDTAKIRTAHKRKAIVASLDLLRRGGMPRALTRPTEFVRRLHDPDAYDAYCKWMSQFIRGVLADPMIEKVRLGELRDNDTTDEEYELRIRYVEEKLGYVDELLDVAETWSTASLSSASKGSIGVHWADGLLCKAAEAGEAIGGLRVVIVGANARGERIYRLEKVDAAAS